MQENASRSLKLTFISYSLHVCVCGDQADLQPPLSQFFERWDNVEVLGHQQQGSPVLSGLQTVFDAQAPSTSSLKESNQYLKHG